MSFWQRAPRTSALFLGVVLVLGAEGVCRLVGVGDPRDRPDPFAGLTGLRPMFERAAGPDGVEIYRVPGPTGNFGTRTFLANKPENGFRIFVFGGSSEVGTPYGYDYGFPAVLESLLTAALADRTVEVVNCATPGFASRRLLYAAEEVRRYEPDLFLISTGHNEMVEQRLYSHLVDSSPWVFAVQQRARQLRLYVLFEDLMAPLRPGDRPEIEGRKIYVPMFGPMASKFWRDEPRDAKRQLYYALRMFRNNVDRMIRVGQEAGATALLLTQSRNYADWGGRGGRRLRPDVPVAQRRIWSRHFGRGERLQRRGDLEGALGEYEAALAAAPEDTAAHRRIADVHRARGDFEAASRYYRRAHDFVDVNFGTTRERNEALRELAAERNVLFLDVDALFQARSVDGLVGLNFFVDFIHPNIAGHQLIAVAVAELLRQVGLPDPAPAWHPLPSLPPPATVLADAPHLRALELKARIVGEVISLQPEDASRTLAELRAVAPGDPHLDLLARWIAGDLPFETNPLR